MLQAQRFNYCFLSRFSQVHQRVGGGGAVSRRVEVCIALFAPTLRLLLLYCCFTAALLLLHCCFTAASLLLHCCCAAAQWRTWSCGARERHFLMRSLLRYSAAHSWQHSVSICTFFVTSKASKMEHLLVLDSYADDCAFVLVPRVKARPCSRQRCFTAVLRLLYCCLTAVLLLIYSV